MYDLPYTWRRLSESMELKIILTVDIPKCLFPCQLWLLPCLTARLNTAPFRQGVCSWDNRKLLLLVLKGSSVPRAHPSSCHLLLVGAANSQLCSAPCHFPKAVLNLKGLLWLMMKHIGGALCSLLPGGEACRSPCLYLNHWWTWRGWPMV